MKTLSSVIPTKTNDNIMDTQSLQKFYVSFSEWNEDEEKTSVVWQCIVSAPSKNEATQFAQKACSAVADLTDCLSYAELHDIGPDELIDVKVVPLNEFINNLEQGADVLKETIETLKNEEE